LKVLESRFQLNDQRVWFGKAKLLADCVVLKGIGFRKQIMLSDIVEVRWAADELIIVTQQGEEVDMTIRAAALWKYELQSRCGLKDAAQSTAQTLNAPHLRDVRPDHDAGRVEGDASTYPVSHPKTEPELRVNPPSRGDGFTQLTDGVDSDEANQDEAEGGMQTDMFLEKESSYRIRSSFAEDRPQSPKRGDDQER